MTPCDRPVSAPSLLDWWTGELAGAEHRSVERHLLSCATCAARAGQLGALALAVRRLVRDGELPAVVLPSVVERLRREGRRVREYRLPPGGGVQCTVGPEDDVVLARLAAEFGGVSRLDLVSRVDDGPERRLADVPFDPAAGELLLMSSTTLLRARPSHVERLRLLALGPEGERLLGEYTFNHTPWPGATAGA
jgi:hypothetical protein